MRSFAFTFFLLILAAGAALVAVLHVKDGSLDRLLGSQGAEIGGNLYKFETQNIHRIHLAGNGVKAECVFEDGMWRIVQPWKDRMDPRVANLIVQFTLGTKVVDIIPEGKIDTAKAGLRDGTIGVLIEDKDGNRLANYLLGRPTLWVEYDKENDRHDSTVFIQPLDEGRSDDTYAGTGDIHSLFRDGFRHLRDHHPFLCNPLLLETVRLKNGEAEVLLSRSGEKAPWRITKPQELPTDVNAVTKLLTDLFKLRAKRVMDRSEVTLPAEETNGRQRIAIKHFGQAQEVILEIMPPASAEAETVYATVSDRPDTVFELLLKPLASVPTETKPGAPAEEEDDDLVSLAELPDTINDLRNPMLTLLNPAAIQGILIHSSTGPEIPVVREQGRDWEYQDTAGKMQPINYATLTRMVGTLTQTRVADFVTDAATDLTPYGLDRPSISLRFLAFGGERYEFVFGRSLDGTWHAMRAGVPTVMRVDDTYVRALATQPWEWRRANPWSIAEVDVSQVERVTAGKPPLLLEYSMIQQSWKATQEGKDRSAELETARADQLLKVLLGLQGERWLAPDDQEAKNALASPALSFRILADAYDKDAVKTGTRQYILRLAPLATTPGNRTWVGQVEGDPNAFRIDVETIQRLAVDVFGD
ncbi:DUF4340 domain-containing protein [Luteolibacter sp. GHJ8]|uniref:DUF4340 domain-containing protein n=1 Tax=Luteolibacter rhizosphaerae TaxID=2989719 RepID=A0ABT3G328_9BACT|nr:DUF4340 domain-containing protein [Luteolibacter rhizosphaerae]MCW1913891.1 DUF4340 domain-containing protein [Luteolibacter rhizosphaerae]